MIVSILLLGFFLRLFLLDQSLWLDEAINVLAVKDYPLKTLITIYAKGDFHPPLYHVILYFWTQAVGYSEIGARFLSVLFGMGTIGVFFLMTKKFFTARVGMMTTLLLATSPLHIYYSQEARMYMMASFFAALSVFFYLHILLRKEKSSQWVWIGYISTTILLLYTEYLPYLLVVAQNLLFLFLPHLRKGKEKTWIVSQGILLLFLSPWIPMIRAQIQTAFPIAHVYPVWNQTVGRSTLISVPLLLVKFFIGRISVTNKFFYTMLISPLFLFLFFLSFQFFRFRLWVQSKILVILALFLFPIFSAYIASFWVSIFSYFRFVFLLPLFYLLLVYIIMSFKQQAVQRGCIMMLFAINILSLGIFYSSPRFWREDWKGAIAFITEQAVSDAYSVMVYAGQEAPYRYYASENTPELMYGQEWQRQHTSEIWLFRYVQPIFDPEDRIRMDIEQAGYKKMEEYDFRSIVVWRYIL